MLMQLPACASGANARSIKQNGRAGTGSSVTLHACAAVPDDRQRMHGCRCTWRSRRRAAASRRPSPRPLGVQAGGHSARSTPRPPRRPWGGRSRRATPRTASRDATPPRPSCSLKPSQLHQRQAVRSAQHAYVPPSLPQHAHAPRRRHAVPVKFKGYPVCALTVVV